MTRSSRIVRDGVTTFALLALLGLLALKLNNHPESVQTGRFYVVDGDTLSQDGKRYRLLGIDAPEYRQYCDRDGSSWACGEESRNALRRLLMPGGVACRGNRHDRYDRLLVTCSLGELDINREMVRTGMAVSYGGYASEEAAARLSKVGVWSANFELPRDYRRDEQAERADDADPLAGLGNLVKGIWNDIRN